MEESHALYRLKQHDEDALAWFIRRYAAYVGTIIYHILGGTMSDQDIEEISSDVFLTLWKNADKVRPGKVKAYLSGTARNMAKDRLRKLGRELPLEEDVLTASDMDPELAIERREQARLVRRALLHMEQPDKEIFLRHYYYGETLARIAEDMGMNLSTVKTRLRRGRLKLKEELREGGFMDEDI